MMAIDFIASTCESGSRHDSTVQTRRDEAGLSPENIGTAIPIGDGVLLAIRWDFEWINQGNTHNVQHNPCCLLSERGGPAPGPSPESDEHAISPWAIRLPTPCDLLMIVGHLPFLGKLAALLVADNEEAEIIAFKFGCVVCVERTENGAWKLAWMIVPALLGAQA